MNIGITCNGNIENLFDNGICFNVILWYDFLEICGYSPYFIVYEKDNPINFIKKKAIDKEYNFLTYNNNKIHIFTGQVWSNKNKVFKNFLILFDKLICLSDKRLQANIGKAEFLDPDSTISPDSSLPPSISIYSMIKF